MANNTDSSLCYFYTRDIGAYGAWASAGYGMLGTRASSQPPSHLSGMKHPALAVKAHIMAWKNIWK